MGQQRRRVLVDIETGDVDERAPPPLDIHILELPSSFYKTIAMLNAQVVMSLPTTENLMSWF